MSKYSPYLLAIFTAVFLSPNAKSTEQNNLEENPQSFYSVVASSDIRQKILKIASDGNDGWKELLKYRLVSTTFKTDAENVRLWLRFLPSLHATPLSVTPTIDLSGQLLFSKQTGDKSFEQWTIQSLLPQLSSVTASALKGEITNQSKLWAYFRYAELFVRAKHKKLIPAKDIPPLERISKAITLAHKFSISVPGNENVRIELERFSTVPMLDNTASEELNQVRKLRSTALVNQLRNDISKYREETTAVVEQSSKLEDASPTNLEKAKVWAEQNSRKADELEKNMKDIENITLKISVDNFKKWRKIFTQIKESMEHFKESNKLLKDVMSKFNN